MNFIKVVWRKDALVLKSVTAGRLLLVLSRYWTFWTRGKKVQYYKPLVVLLIQSFWIASNHVLKILKTFDVFSTWRGLLEFDRASWWCIRANNLEIKTQIIFCKNFHNENIAHNAHSYMSPTMTTTTTFRPNGMCQDVCENYHNVEECCNYRCLTERSESSCELVNGRWMSDCRCMDSWLGKKKIHFLAKSLPSL